MRVTNVHVHNYGLLALLVINIVIATLNEISCGHHHDGGISPIVYLAKTPQELT